MPPVDHAIASFLERSGAIIGSPIQVILHKQRLARRIASEHGHQFTADDLLQAIRPVGAGRPAQAARHTTPSRCGAPAATLERCRQRSGAA